MRESYRRRREGNCVRCVKKGHRVPNCPFLPPQYPETEISVSSSSVNKKFQDDVNIDEIDEVLKEFPLNKVVFRGQEVGFV